MRDFIEGDAAQLAIDRDFAEIDRSSDEYVAQASRTSSGLWLSGLFGGGVTKGLMTPAPQSDEDWDRLEAETLKWARNSPQSALARLTHADIIVSRAWKIRGGDYAHKVAPGAWKPFHAHLKRARAYLEREKEVASRNPHYYADMIQIIRAEKGEGDPEPVLKEGIARYPGYYPMYFAMLDYLLPKWHGDAKRIEKFAREAVERTSSFEGESMYARIYWAAAQGQYEDSLFFASFAHWDRMKAGFDDVIKRYPDQWNLQNYAKFACDAQDAETLAKVLEKVEEPIVLDAWGSTERYEQCQRMAGRLRL